MEYLGGVQQHHEPFMEDEQISDVVITNKSPEDGLSLAVTQGYVCWSDEGRKSLTAALKCMPVPADDREDYGPVFFKVGGIRKDRITDLIYVLFWRATVVICEEIEINGDGIKFKSADTFTRPTKHRDCTQCLHETVDWQSAAKSEDILLTLDRSAIASIQRACDHWDEFFCIRQNGKIRFNNGSSVQVNHFVPDDSFDPPYKNLYGRNWDGFDFDSSLTIVSTAWPFPHRFD